MNAESDRDFLDLESDYTDEIEFGEDDDPNELGDGGGELEAISAYEVGTLGELEDVDGESEIDEPWQSGLEDDEVDFGELEFESEEGFDDETGDEEFFGFIKKIGRGLGRLIKKGARALGKIVGPLLKKLGPIAARIVGGAIGGPAGAAIGGTIASSVLREGEMETEIDTEAEFAHDEQEFELVGGDPESYGAMLEYAEEMADAESERRADRAFVAMSRRAALMFRRNRRVRRVIPLVLRAAFALAKTFRRNRRTRWAIRAIPLIVRRTLTRLARTRRIDRRAVVVAMSRETAWVLANRRRAMLSMRRRPHRSRRRRRARRPRRAMRETFAY